MSSPSFSPSEHHPIPPIRPIPRRDWKIPIGGTRDEVEDRFPNLKTTSLHGDAASYEGACQELEDLGFSMVHCVKSIRHYRIKYTRKDQEKSFPLSEFSIWHHPAGMVLVVESGDLGNSPPSLESIRGYFQVDLGAGDEFSILWTTKTRSSGYTLRMMDGTRLKVGSISSSSGEGSFIDHLISIQKYGRLNPLERWVEEGHIAIPQEILFPLTDASFGKGGISKAN